MSEKRKILCVDDEPTVLSVTTSVLRDLFPEHEITGISVPEDACTVLANAEIAVLISDLSMPNMDGAELIRKAHEANPCTVSVLVTGRASTDALIKALNEGHLWKCLPKPWGPNDIETLVRDGLDLYEKRKAAAANADVSQKGAAKLPVKGPLKKVSLVRRPSVQVAPKKPVYRFGGNKVKTKKLRIMDSRYKDMDLIREGGSGAVYRAYDSLLDTVVAIKIISEEISSNATAMKELVSEAKIAMGLTHKHIVRLHNIEQGNNFYYLVMEYIKGESLRDFLHRMDALPPEMVIQIVDILEDALGYAHRRGVFHRDMKPDNVMVTEDGVLKIIDFGLACLAETFRRGGEIAGTPYYMSPEEMICQTPDQRTDIFSVGVMIHELLQGNLPPHGGEADLEDPLEYLPVASPLLPEPVQEVLQKSFARERGDRWNDMTEFADAFRRAMSLGYHAV